MQATVSIPGSRRNNHCTVPFHLPRVISGGCLRRAAIPDPTQPMKALLDKTLQGSYSVVIAQQGNGILHSVHAACRLDADCMMEQGILFHSSYSFLQWYWLLCSDYCPWKCHWLVSITPRCKSKKSFSGFKFKTLTFLSLSGYTVCPNCSNVLTISRADPTPKFPLGVNRFECRTCPYQYVLKGGWSEKTPMKQKEVEDVFGGKEEFANADSMGSKWKSLRLLACGLEAHHCTAQCPSEDCNGDRAYFFQLQIRSADEPMTTFLKVCILDSFHLSLLRRLESCWYGVDNSVPHAEPDGEKTEALSYFILFLFLQQICLHFIEHWYLRSILTGEWWRHGWRYCYFWYLVICWRSVDITPYAHSLKEIPNKPGHVRSAAEKIFIFFFGSRNNQ